MTVCNDFRCCATCRHWEGDREVDGIVIHYDEDEVAKCPVMMWDLKGESATCQNYKSIG